MYRSPPCHIQTSFRLHHLNYNITPVYQCWRYSELVIYVKQDTAPNVDPQGPMKSSLYGSQTATTSTHKQRQTNLYGTTPISCASCSSPHLHQPPHSSTLCLLFSQSYRNLVPSNRPTPPPRINPYHQFTRAMVWGEHDRRVSMSKKGVVTLLPNPLGAVRDDGGFQLLSRGV